MKSSLTQEEILNLTDEEDRVYDLTISEISGSITPEEHEELLTAIQDQTLFGIWLELRSFFTPKVLSWAKKVSTWDRFLRARRRMRKRSVSLIRKRLARNKKEDAYFFRIKRGNFSVR